MTLPAGLKNVVAALVLFAAGALSAPALGDSIFRSPVVVDGATVGVFEIDVYRDDSAGSSFGIAIGGGFNPSSSYTLPDGYQYRWIQTVTTSLPAYAWQSAEVEYVDRSRELADDRLARSNSPFYADGEVVPGSPYALQFADNPARELGPDEFQGTWALSLVAVQPPTDTGRGFNQPEPGVTRAIYQLATFVWGFDARLVGGSMEITLHPITEIPPDPAALAAAFLRDPDAGTFGGGAWDIRSGLPGSSPGAIPEPSSYLLALSSLVAAALPIHRARRRVSN